MASFLSKLDCFNALLIFSEKAFKFATVEY